MARRAACGNVCGRLPAVGGAVFGKPAGQMAHVFGIKRKDLGRSVDEMGGIAGAIGNAAPELGTRLDDGDRQRDRGLVEQFERG